MTKKIKSIDARWTVTFEDDTEKEFGFADNFACPDSYIDGMEVEYETGGVAYIEAMFGVALFRSLKKLDN